ncbi:MAG: class I SAM-dependent methyltransferase [Chloroflexi bacterium]|nr:class I SAM-dependent methyltransferase [Chloroflexota bacterium]
MRKDSIKLEESRVADSGLVDYPPFKERHRVFPAVFESRNHRKILDLAAGIGYVTQRLLDHYPATIISHDVSPSCLKNLHLRGAPTLSFDIDNAEISFPFASGTFDAVISLVTIEHLLFVNEFLSELNRILCDGGYLYISTPNYAAPEYLAGPVLHGRAFHDPISPASRYEFFAHVRYFTFKTLGGLVDSHGFALDSVYIALPDGSDRYQKLFKQSKLKALTFRSLMWVKAKLLPLYRSSEPILCFQKTSTPRPPRFRKVLL